MNKGKKGDKGNRGNDSDFELSTLNFELPK